MQSLQNLIGEPTAEERQAFQKIAAGKGSAAAALSEIRTILAGFAGDGKRPTIAALNRIQDLAHSSAEPEPTLSFSREQLKMIAEALLTHEVDLVRRSEMFTTRAETAATPEKVSRALALADERFSQSCDARDLSERISAEIRRAGK